jgi:hypothetical protein
MFSRKNTAIASRPRLDIWIKRTKIEQVRKHKILGLASILEWTGTNTSSVQKQKQKKINIIKCLAHTKWGPRKPSHYTQNDNTNHLKIRRIGLRLSVQSSAKKDRTNLQGRDWPTKWYRWPIKWYGTFSSCKLLPDS